MKIAILTSSRADFGIYLPLLNALQGSSHYKLKIVAFGTHLSAHHGRTINEIKSAGFDNIDTIHSLLLDDSAEAIATGFGITYLKFVDYWANNRFDLVLCLGDRFEMQAAVQAGIPTRVKFAHFHGGETTEGAIDNIYRHQITLASFAHFVSTDQYAKRVREILGHGRNVFSVGSMALHNFENLELPAFSDVQEKFKLPVGKFALVTFHPETVAFDENYSFAREMQDALEILSQELNLVVTLPNADTLGSLYREKLEQLFSKKPQQIKLIESFGKFNYFSVMEQAEVVIGNSSSGIIEAASFKKWVVNVGERQLGRAQSENTLNASFNSTEIIEATKLALSKDEFQGANIYYKKESVENVYHLLQSLVND